MDRRTTLKIDNNTNLKESKIYFSLKCNRMTNKAAYAITYPVFRTSVCPIRWTPIDNRALE